MANLSTEILRDTKQTIVYQRIIIILLIILLIGVTLYKFPEQRTKVNQVQYVSEVANYMPITNIKPAEYSRAKFKKFRFGTT